MLGHRAMNTQCKFFVMPLCPRVQVVSGLAQSLAIIAFQTPQVCHTSRTYFSYHYSIIIIVSYRNSIIRALCFTGLRDPGA
jgi:hypothetical protein